MLKILIRALLALAIMVLACGVIYPAAVTLASQELFPRQAAGSLVYKDGAPVGSALIAQNWTQTRYFQGRPSANPGGANNAMTSGASNAGPTSLQLVEEVEERVADLKEANPDAEGAVPQDLVTASASGLDPHISPEAALWQAPRVARARGVEREAVERLVRACTEKPAMGLLGAPRVNVLRLNLELDRLHPVKEAAPVKKAPKKPRRQRGRRRQ